MSVEDEGEHGHLLNPSSSPGSDHAGSNPPSSSGIVPFGFQELDTAMVNRGLLWVPILSIVWMGVFFVSLLVQAFFFPRNNAVELCARSFATKRMEWDYKNAKLEEITRSIERMSELYMYREGR